MDICKTYPKFQPDQVLTADQLNALFAYLDQQNRWTRKCFIGAGIACGMEIVRNDLDKTVTVSAGSGLTTQGYHVHPATAICTHYRDYVDPVHYPFMRLDDQQVDLWQLLPTDSFDPEDSDNKPIDPALLDDKVLLMYLEIQDIDLDTCTGSDCDEKGIEVTQCVRYLLLRKSDLQALLAAHKARHQDMDYQAYLNRFELPRLTLARLPWLGDSQTLLTLEDIYKGYAMLVQDEVLERVRAAFDKLFSTYREAVADDFAHNPFDDWKPGLSSAQDSQYFYDHLRDLIVAYDELNTAGFAAFAHCCIVESAFPRHLLLGCLKHSTQCEPDVYRHGFYPSQSAPAQDRRLQEVGSLFRRLVLMTRAYRSPAGKSMDIRITPSADLLAPLGHRAIPCYYDLSSFPGLRRVWDYQTSERCQSETITGYHYNRSEPDCSWKVLEKSPSLVMQAPAEFPLLGDIDHVPFFRIEGHLGRDYNQARSEIRRWIQCFNLPIKLVGLRAGRDFGDVDIELNCEFDDIDLLYGSLGERIRCYLQATRDRLLAIDFDEPVEEQKETGETGLQGVFIDAKTKRPLADVYVGVSDVRQIAQSDKSGRFEMFDLSPGRYTVTTFIKGYGSKSFTARVSAGRVNDLGSIALEQGASRLDKEFQMSGLAAEVERLLREESAGPAKKPAKNPRSSPRNAPDNDAKKSLDDNGEVVKLEERLIRAATDSPYSIAAVYDYQHGVDPKDGLLATRYYLYNQLVNSRVQSIQDVLDKVHLPVQIASTIDTLMTQLQGPLADFDYNGFSVEYELLLARLDAFRETLVSGRFGDLLTAEDQRQLLHYFDLLRQQNCFNQFDDLMQRYNDRRRKLQFMHLLSVYAEKHPGMTHIAGCRSGGTFFLVYDERQRVMLDFALPYLCCSDCPPIQYCDGYPVVFKLAQERFCKTDSREFRFITSPPGGEVTGPGVRKDTTSGDFYFLPAAEDVSAGRIEFQYFFNNASYTFSILVEAASVAISYRLLKVDSDARRAEVAFRATPDTADAYEWHFGDGETADQVNPVHVYDLAEQSSFEVLLRVAQGGCRGEDRLQLGFDLCNADFSVQEITRRADSVTFLFRHAQDASSRLWDMGDGTRIEALDVVEHVYPRVKQDVEISVSLTVTEETCSDSSSSTLLIPALQPVSIVIARTSFCRAEEPELLIVDPPGGEISGPGVVHENAEVYFYPGAADVVIGVNTIEYRLNGQSTSLELTVSQISGETRASVISIDGVKKTADVRISAPPDMDSYAIETGDGGNSEAQSFVHQYDLTNTVEFEIVARLTRGACQAVQRRHIDLTPCSAEFAWREISNDGEFVSIEYNARQTDAKTYRLTDELGSVESSSPRIQRAYPVKEAQRRFSVSLEVFTDICRNVFTDEVSISGVIPLVITTEIDEFVDCDKESYPVFVSPPGGIASGPGLRQDGDSVRFTPRLAGASGVLTLSYSVNGRSASTSVRVRKPQADFAIRSITRVDAASYEVSVINRSSDFNESRWVFEPGGESSLQEPVIKLENIKPGEYFTVQLMVSWDGLCLRESTLRGFQIPADDGAGRVPDLGGTIGRLDALAVSEGFARVMPADGPVIHDFKGALASLEQELSNPEQLKAYRDGSRNDQLAETFDRQMTAVVKSLSTASAANPETAQGAYPLFVHSTSALLDMLSMVDRDLVAGEALSATLSNTARSAQLLKERGLALDKGGELSAVLKRAQLDNQNKPNALKIIDDLAAIVNA